MTDHNSSWGYTDGDVDTNNTGNRSLESIVQERYSRRQTLFGGVGATAMALFGTSILAACGDGNEAPVVGAGQAGSSTSGRVVTLAGTASDDKAVTGFAWTQVSGPTVTLTPGAAGSNSATFLAPSVAAATELKFKFEATDEKGKASSAETTVTVGPAVLGFATVAKNRNDVVTVPDGYKVTVMTRMGDPLAAGVAAYKNDGTDTDFANRIGDHGDALYWYGLSAAGARDDNGSTRGLMVQNHENLNVQYLHPNGPTNIAAGPRPEAEAIKEIEAHGVSVSEYADSGNRTWAYVAGSAFNRRVTPNTPMTFTGPVAGAAVLKTAFAPDGLSGRGTINNCANGHTAWGTNLTCEENWAGYFKRGAADNANRSAREITQLSRYGVSQGAGGSYAWATVTPSTAGDTRFRRWDVTVDTTKPADGTGDFRNEANQFGWVVEIDPYDKTAAPRKRTALGRFGHEGAWMGKLTAGKKIAVYLGDVSRGEYLYKFVSNAARDAADAQAAGRIAMGDKYLNAGTLYVAKFNADGSGAWQPLVFGQVPTRPASGSDAAYVFQDQADILTFPRLAADAVGATKMDRPEWTASNPVTGEIYLTLTNNSAALRPLNGTDAANPRHYNDPKGTTNQFGNPNGHIIRLRENADDPAATGFAWDIYLFGADSIDADPANVNLSGLTAGNDFSSPDGLWFARSQNASGLVKPVLWIQTDDGAFTDRTNCMMLAAMPGTVGDGGVKTIVNKDATGATATQATRVGAVATDATLKRFLVGPVECEITGVDSTPDGRTLFVGIQHPGENGTPAAPSSHWPDSQATGTAGATVRPRSAIVAITKNDGGVVAL